MPALLPAERELARRRQSLVVLVELPGKYVAIVLAALALAAVVKPVPMLIVFVLVVGLAVLWRWLNWRAEWVLLTDKRIIRVQGLPETTELEAFLRVDRISGVVLVQSLAGKMFGYGTIYLEAPGDHPTLRKLEKIADVGTFSQRLRDAVFGTRPVADPDDESRDHVTEPLPVIRDRAATDRPPRDRLGRRQGW